MNRTLRTALTAAILVAGAAFGPAGCGDSSAPDPGTQALDTGLREYDAIRKALAHDRLEGLEEHAIELDARLGAIVPDSTVTPGRIDVARRAAATLAGAKDLETARDAFAELSHAMIDLVASVPPVARTHYLFSCPMTEGFNQWIQESPKIENPYMGTRMPACGSAADWQAPDAAGDPGGIAYWTCAMHPSVRQTGPGTCPICSMDLIPVTREEAHSGVIRVDETRRQMIGLRTAPVTRRPLHATVRTVGTIVVDQTRLTDVSLKIDGWVGTLMADAEGIRVERGRPLFTFYSPALYAAQKDFLTALASQTRAAGTSAPDRADYLVNAARERLRLWDLTADQIEALAASGVAQQYVPILSPAGGYVVEKHVVEGASVKAGERLFRIAGLDRVWIEAEFYESDAAYLETGLPVSVTLPYADRTETGVITFIYPYLDDASRTVRARIELPNPGLDLKPDMFANVELDRDLGIRLAVPEEAILHTGTRDLVFLDLGEGRLKPQEITLGVGTAGYREVTSGLAEGDLVVTSGNFLIDAESRLKSSMEQWNGQAEPDHTNH